MFLGVPAHFMLYFRYIKACCLSEQLSFTIQRLVKNYRAIAHYVGAGVQEVKLLDLDGLEQWTRTIFSEVVVSVFVCFGLEYINGQYEVRYFLQNFLNIQLEGKFQNMPGGG